MSVKENIKTFIKNENITIKEFEISISASNGYVNSISKSIGLDKLNSIIEKYPNLNIEWLLTGKGEMYKNITSEKDRPVQFDNLINENEKEKLPLYNKIIELQEEKIAKLQEDLKKCEDEKKLIQIIK